MSSSYDSAVIDVAMVEDPRLLTLSRGVRLLHLEALVWCKARLTDGFIPVGALRRMTDEEYPDEGADMLVGAGVWESVESGWQIVGFTDTQMSAARVKEKREAARERYDRWQTTQPAKRVGNATTNDPSRPALPSRKGGREVGGQEAAASAEGGASSLAQCSSCRLYFIDEDAHQCSEELRASGPAA